MLLQSFFLLFLIALILEALRQTYLPFSKILNIRKKQKSQQ